MSLHATHSPYHDARRSNGAPNHPPGCTCPFHGSVRFPHRIEVRLTQADWDAMNEASARTGMSRAEIMRLGLSRLIESGLASGCEAKEGALGCPVTP